MSEFSIKEAANDEILDWLKDSPSESKIKRIKKIAFDKNFRPESIEQQYHLLQAISDNFDIPSTLKAFCCIAAVHKAMESLDESLVSESLKKIQGILDDEPGEFSEKIRENRIHIKFSAYSVMYHAHFYLGDIESGFSCSEQALNYFESLDEDCLTQAFYQTCTNAARCMAIAALAGVAKQDKELLVRSVEGVTKAFFWGANHSWNHETIFLEYIGSTSIYHGLRPFTRRFPNVRRVDQVSVFNSALRRHNPDKVSKMIQNYETYLQDSSQSKMT